MARLLSALLGVLALLPGGAAALENDPAKDHPRLLSKREASCFR